MVQAPLSYTVCSFNVECFMSIKRVDYSGVFLSKRKFDDCVWHVEVFDAKWLQIMNCNNRKNNIIMYWITDQGKMQWPNMKVFQQWIRNPLLLLYDSWQMLIKCK